jgi:TolA-binding protein
MVADALNRKADCLFYARDFAAAAKSYAEATTTDPSQGDYALYQHAFVQGLQKDYQGKVVSLNTMIDRFPQSSYVDDALYERGRAYVQMEQNVQAISSFKELTDRFPESVLARKAASEIGMLYYQDDRFTEAIAAYKQVIEKYPGSDEARMAGRDLKNIYIEQNRVDDYAAYAAQQKGSIQFDTNERDSLTYLAAEKVYMRGDMQEAEKSMAAYLQSFPEGAYRLNAHYYLGVAAYERKEATTALAHFDKVLEFPAGKFSEEAMTMASELAYSTKDYTRALTLYKLLKGKTTSAERLLLARTGILRSAHLLADNQEVIVAATELLDDSKTSPELANEARYYRSRAAAKQGNRELAGKDLQELSKDTRHIYGAEAKYRLAEMHYTAKEYAEAEKVLLNYIEVSTPHMYWLARSFVLLSDVYMQTGREIEAKQYLLSLQQNYTANDDIAGMIEERLAHINKE